MKRALYLGAMTWLVGSGAVGCGSKDDHPGNVKHSYAGETSEGGSTHATGGKANNAGRAGAAGNAGRAGVAGGLTVGTAGSGQAGAAGYVGIAGNATTSGTYAPIVTIATPAAGDVLIQDKVDVNCLIAGADPAMLTTTEIVLWQGDVKVAPTGNPVRDSTKGTTATFSLVSLSSGPVSFRCTSGGMTGQLDTYVDRGPTIAFVNPDPAATGSTTSPTPIAVKQLLTVTFDVTAQPLNGGDAQGAIDPSSITFSIDGNFFTVSPLVDTPNRYSTVKINLLAQPFTSSSFPNGSTTLKVVASNLRKATVTKELRVNIDGKGPDIVVTYPTTVARLEDTIISGLSKLVFDVTDPKTGTDQVLGVSNETVTVTVGNKAFIYRTDDLTHWSHSANSNTFTFVFTEADLAGSQAQATIGISAADKGGNIGTPESFPVYLDTVPPYVDLDPPTLRELYPDTNKVTCSDAFDPLGEAVSDRAYLKKPAKFRAFVWDRTNDPGSGNIPILSLTDQSQVSIFVQGRPQVALLADTDNDGICDDIASNTNLSLQLRPLAPTGTAPRYVTKSTTDPTVTNWADDTRFWYPPTTDNVCSVPTSTAQVLETVPSYLCGGDSEMVRVVKHDVQSNEPEPAVYAVTPDDSGVKCNGTYWDFSEATQSIPTTETDGWVCLAARAVDNVSNVGISRVLRVCYFDTNIGVGAPKCAQTDYVEDVTKSRSVPRWVPASRSSDDDMYISKQYGIQPDCLCEAGQNICVPKDPGINYYCSSKKAVCNDASKPASMVAANLCNAGQTLCSPALASRCVESAAACASTEVAIAGDVACPVGTKRCLTPSAANPPYCVDLDRLCTNPADFAVDDSRCPNGQKLCLPRPADYCVNAGASCQGTDEVTARGYQCPLDQQLCVPHDPSRPTYCVAVNAPCNGDHENSADTTTCAASKKACVRWDSGPTYCVDKLTGSCDWDLPIAINECPSCPPMRYDVLAKKPTGAVCQPDDTDPGCRPENTVRCSCGPLCAAETTASTPGCVPFLRYPKKDPCEQTCRPPTNAFARRYVGHY